MRCPYGCVGRQVFLFAEFLVGGGVEHHVGHKDGIERCGYLVVVLLDDRRARHPVGRVDELECHARRQHLVAVDGDQGVGAVDLAGGAGLVSGSRLYAVVHLGIEHAARVYLVQQLVQHQARHIGRLARDGLVEHLYSPVGPVVLALDDGQEITVYAVAHPLGGLRVALHLHVEVGHKQRIAPRLVLLVHIVLHVVVRQQQHDYGRGSYYKQEFQEKVSFLSVHH